MMNEEGSLGNRRVFPELVPTLLPSMHWLIGLMQSGYLS